MFDLFHLFIIIALSLYAILAFLDRRLALIIFVFLLPSYLLRLTIPAEIGPLQGLPTTVLEIMFILLALAWMTMYGKEEHKHNLRPWGSGLALLMLGSIVGVLVAPNLVSALGVWRAYFLEPIFFLLIFVDVARDETIRRQIVGALGVSVAIIGVIAVIQKFTGWWIPNPVWVPEETRRVTAWYGFPNGIGLFVAPIVMLLLSRAAHQIHKVFTLSEKRFPFYTTIAAVLGILAIVFAVSEGAIIGLAVGLVVLGLALPSLRKATLLLIIAGCLTTMLYPPLRTYAGNMLGMRDDSWRVRRIVWSESIDMISDRPVFGAGLDGYQQTLEPYHQAKHIEIFKYPHNYLLNFWTETGLIGVAGFFLLLIAYFKITIDLVFARPNDWLPVGLVAAMIVLLIHGLVDVPYFKNDLAILFFVLIGLAESLRREQLAVDQPSKA